MKRWDSVHPQTCSIYAQSDRIKLQADSVSWRFSVSTLRISIHSLDRCDNGGDATEHTLFLTIILATSSAAERYGWGCSVPPDQEAKRVNWQPIPMTLMPGPLVLLHREGVVKRQSGHLPLLTTALMQRRVRPSRLALYCLVVGTAENRADQLPIAVLPRHCPYGLEGLKP